MVYRIGGGSQNPESQNPKRQNLERQNPKY